MTDEDKTQLAISRGARAKALLGDDLYCESFYTLETEYLKAWRETGPKQMQERELLWQAIQVLGKVRDHLKVVVDNGKIAQAELDRLKGMR